MLRRIGLLLLTTWMILVCVPVYASGNPTVTMALHPSADGRTLTAEIDASALQDMFAFEVTLTAQGAELTLVEGNTELEGMKVVQNDGNQFRFAFSRTGNTPGYHGDLKLCVLKFSARTSGNLSLSLSSVKISDSSLRETVIPSGNVQTADVVAAQAKNFKDMGDFPWAAEAVRQMSLLDIIHGVSDDSYAPGESITRADFLTLLIRTLDLKAVGGQTFEDVKPDDYYFNAVMTARKLGIVSGKTSTLFAPGESITRQDMMLMCRKAMVQAGRPGVAGTEQDMLQYHDSETVDSYARDSVAAMVHSGLIRGDGVNLNPKSATNRAEAAVILYKIYNFGKAH